MDALRFTPRSKQSEPENAAFVRRTLYFMGGAEPELLAQCPQSDKQYFLLIGGTLALVWCFHVCLITYSLTQAFGTDVGGILGSFAGALIAASLIVAFDMLVIRGVLDERGRADLERGGLIVGGRPAHQDTADHKGSNGRSDTAGILISLVNKWAPMVFRLGLSFGTASLIAIFFMLYFFRTDIEARIAADYNVTNAATLAKASQTVTARITELQHEIQSDEALVKAANDQRTRLGSAVTGPPADTVEGAAIQDLLKRVSSLQQEVSTAASNVNEAKLSLNDEINGIKEHGASGVATCKEKCEGRKANLTVAESEFADKSAALKAAQADLAIEQARVSAGAQSELAAVAAQHDDAGRDSADALKRLPSERKALEVLQRRSTSEREEAYKETPMSQGPFARVDALFKLLEGSRGAATVDFWLGVFIMSLELSAIIGTLSNRVALTYTRLKAAREVLGLQETLIGIVEQQAALESAMRKRLSNEDTAIGSGDDRPQGGPSPLDRTPYVANGVMAAQPSEPTGGGKATTPKVEPQAQRESDEHPRNERTATPNGKIDGQRTAHGDALKIDKPNGHNLELTKGWLPPQGIPILVPGWSPPDGIPTMIPGWARKKLFEIGYTLTNIRELTPRQVYEILDLRGLWIPPNRSPK